MRMLLLHSDFIEYKTTKKTKIAEEIDKNSGRAEEVLVVFTAVEPGDSDKIAQIADSIKEVQEWTKADKLFFYPYAHLSDQLSKPAEAIEVLDKLAETFGAERAPFGWYKRFTISVKGHPMAEFSRRI
ncbi:MAG: hypothetical protein GOU99_01860 [Candidatus Altiarchaeota archaeon]|nr:hypothetical protein [Candidatus Altiarchaeota archaeon]